MSDLRVISPDQTMLAIVKLFLEKYEALESVDREMFRKIIPMLAVPMMMMGDDEVRRKP